MTPQKIICKNTQTLESSATSSLSNLNFKYSMIINIDFYKDFYDKKILEISSKII